MKKNFRSFSAVTATILLLLFTHLTARSQSFDFDGSNDNATATSVLTGVTNNFTLECWVYPRANNVYRWALCLSTSYIGLGMSDGGTFTYLINGSTGSASTTLPLNIWTHIALVRRSGTYELYKNGVFYTTSQQGAPPAPDGNLQISRASGEIWQGAIDEVRIWNVARTATEIANNYTTGISTSSGLVASYRNNAGTPNANNTAITTLTDYSLAGHTGSDVYTYNLIPNPYPSSIVWNTAGAGWTTSAGIGGTCYIWNAANGNYSSVASSATAYIPVGQALMVLTTNDASPALSVNNTARVHSNQAFYKSGSIANQLTIKATANDYADETVVHFIGEATEGFDLQVDGMKLQGLEDAPQLYTVSAGQKFSISNLPEFPEQVTVPVNFETKYTGNVVLTFSQIESFPATMSIKLEDKLTGQMTNLRQQPSYIFTHQQGNASDRFVLHFGGASGVEEPGMARGKIWISENTVNIYSPATVGEKALVEIFNTAGQVVFNKQVMLSELTRVPVSLSGIAVVRVTTSKELMVKKGFFR